MNYNNTKKIIDFFLSLLFIILFSPLLILTYIIAFICSGSPVIFTQKRPGKNQKIFKIYKFRTMINGARKKHLNGTDPYSLITPIGKILRKTNIDELPQLFNILKGDMSFVGPRPLSIKDFKEHLKLDTKYVKVTKSKPGLVSLNNILGYMNYEKRIKIMNKMGFKKRSNIEKDSRLSYNYHQKLKEREYYYLKHKSFKLDLQIIWWTFLLQLKIFKKLLK